MVSLLGRCTGRDEADHLALPRRDGRVAHRLAAWPVFVGSLHGPTVSSYSYVGRDCSQLLVSGADLVGVDRTAGDVLTVPKLKGVKPGDTLLLTRVVELGSRDYTLRAASSVSSMSEERFESPATALRPPLSRAQDAQETPRDWQRYPDSLPALRPGAFVRAKVTVIEHTKGRMFEVEKFKKRKGYRRTLRSKLAFTRVRVGDFEFPPASGAV